MHVAVGVFLAIASLLLLVGLMGATPFIGIPVAVVLRVAPFVWAALAGGRAAGGGRLEKQGVPTTEEVLGGVTTMSAGWLAEAAAGVVHVRVSEPLAGIPLTVVDSVIASMPVARRV